MNVIRMQRYWSFIMYILLAIAGLSLFITNTASDMEQTPQPKVDASTAIDTATQFLTQHEILTNISSYRTSVIYTNDAIAHSFIRQQFGSRTASHYLENHSLPQIEQEVRFYQPKQQQEVTVKVDAVTNTVTEVSHTLPADRNRTSVTQEEAQNLSLDYIQDRGIATETLTLRDYAQNTRDSRTDHRFTYAVNNTTINSSFGTARLLVEVGIQGDRLGVYDYYMKTPTDFSRYVGGQRGSGMFIAGLSLLATVAMLIIAGITVIHAFRKIRPHWRALGLLGIGIAILLFVNQLNTLPIAMHQYQTAVAVFVFLGIALISALITAVAQGGMVSISATAGSNLAVHYWPQRIREWKQALQNNAWPLIVSTARGYAIAFALLGLTAILYAIGSAVFDVWQFASIKQLNLLNAYVPALMIFTAVALFPAVSEELLYRLFGITFFSQATRSTSLAIVITAIIWGVAHATHPVFPFYFRAIEVLIVGIILGIAFVMHDITTTLTAHYVFNAVTAFPLFLLATGPFTIVTSILVILLPLLAASGWWLQCHRSHKD